jgi:hypothetical protein
MSIIDNKFSILSSNKIHIEFPRDVIGGYTSFTALAKFRFNSVGFSIYSQYLTYTLMSIEDEWSLDINATHPSLLLNDSGSVQSSETAGASVAADIDHVVAAVYNAQAQTITLYLDGALLASTTYGTIGSAPFESGNPLRIGRRLSTQSNCLDVVIYEVRFYKSAMTLGEIQNYTDYPDYNGGLVFFVGGDAERDAVSGELTSVDFADVSTARREELRRLIIKTKPLHSWGGLLVNYT